jgi:hypothetical protein
MIRRVAKTIAIGMLVFAAWFSTCVVLAALLLRWME